MSTELVEVEKEIARFLASPEPEVLCISGKWGVGKTFSWNVFLRTAKDEDRIEFDSYAYVSLFGLDSLDQLKYAVFENSIAIGSIGVEPSLETFRSNTADLVDRVGRKSLKFLDKLPFIKNYAAALQSLSFLSVQKMVVCIDDLERKGTRLPIKDLLGLISHLRDQKQCKVVVIMNDDELHDDADKKEFERYREKAIDISIEFSPNASECVRIAITDDSVAHDLLRKNIVALGISNIRIIKKIERLVLRVVPLVNDFDRKILEQAVHSLTLLGWSVFAAGSGAPTIEFLRKKRSWGNYGDADAEDQPDDEKKWNALLDDIGFTIMDDFDLVLLEGIKRGYFDEAALKKWAEKLDKTIKAGQSEEALRAAWNTYHDSFDDNEAEVVEAISAACRENVRAVTPMNLDGAIRLLKDLGEPNEATDLIRHYMDERDEVRDFFDLTKQAFGDEVKDPDVRAAFDEKYQSFAEDRLPVEVLLRIGKNDSWSRDDITLLSNLSVDDFYDMFKAQKDDLSRIVRTSLSFGRIANADADIKMITEIANEALVRIGRESRLNRRRVMKFGVEMRDEDA